MKAFPQVDVLDEVLVVLEPFMVEPQPSGDAAKSNEDDDAKTKPLTLLLRAAAVETLGLAFVAVRNDVMNWKRFIDSGSSFRQPQRQRKVISRHW
jgi:hypothetical protein